MVTRTVLHGLYNERILALAESLKVDDRLDQADATVMRDSPLCGSRVTVDLCAKRGIVTAYGQQVRACALGQCAAAVMARHAVGRTLGELRQVRDVMAAMLKQNGPPPVGLWAELAALEPACAHKSRHASILLPFEATVAAMEQIEAAEKVGNRDASPQT